MVKVAGIKLFQTSISVLLLLQKEHNINFAPLKKMKKLFTVLSMALVLGFASAQQVTPAKSTITPPQVKVQTTKPAATKTTVVKNVVAPKPAKTTTAVVMKKDGTPDKRYKVNQHLKKDGTRDKRYKK